MRARKLTLDQATDWARERGLRTERGNSLARSDIHFILTNPAYYGVVRTKYGLHRGSHETIVSQRLFDEVQELLNRGLAGTAKHENHFKGLLTCAHCGRALTLTNKTKGGKHYRYCHCYAPKAECPRPTFAESKLSDALGSVFEGIHVSPGISSMLRQLIEESQAEQHEYQRTRNAQILTLQAELQAKKEEQHAALRKHLSGVIAEDAYLPGD